MAKATVTKKINPDKIPVAARAYCASKIIQIYDLCNDCDNLDVNSPIFQKRKKEFDEKLKNNDEATFDKLYEWQVLDDNGFIQSDEALLKKMKEFAPQVRDIGMSEILNKLQENGLMEYTLALLPSGVNDWEKLKNNPQRGFPKKLREQLAFDFAQAKLEDPDNELLQEPKLIDKIEKQLTDLPFIVTAVEANKEVNHDIYDEFDATKRAEFLKFMGNFIEVGSELSKNKNISNYIYDNIRKTLENPELTNAEIAKVAQKTYKTAIEGCWNHKQKHFPDERVTKDDYIKTNISAWIRDLGNGNTGFKSLGFLSPKEDAKYNLMSDKQKREVECSHITVHHKIDRKYHGLFKSWDNKKLLNKIFNLELVIDKSLHEKKHEGEKDDIKVGNKSYYLARIDKEIDSSIICAPTDKECNPNRARETAIKAYVPEVVTKVLSNISPKNVTQVTQLKEQSR
mgnify:CR=1 FL=1